MARCVKCGKEADDVVRALAVETLHVRDISGEKRVQALGDFREFGICDECARETLKAAAGTDKKKLLPYVVVLVLGVVVGIVLHNMDSVIRMVGFAAIICGLLGSVSVIKEEKQRSREYAALNSEHAMKRAAWETVISAVPKKDGDNDVTYIPITDETMKMKNGDLMIVYELLPDIAVRAWNLLHGIEGGVEASTAEAADMEPIRDRAQL